MDYASLKEKVYQGVRDKLTKQALNDRITMSWEQISVAEICKSISGWKKWLRLVMEEDRGHIGHRLKKVRFPSIPVLHFCT